MATLDAWEALRMIGGVYEYKVRQDDDQQRVVEVRGVLVQSSTSDK